MEKREKEDVLKMRDFRKERKLKIKDPYRRSSKENLLIKKWSEQILRNPKEKISGVGILTAKEKPLKKNIFLKKENLQQGNGRETIFEISNESENKDHRSVKKENQ